MAARVTFDAATHTYYADGQAVPNVTAIMAPLLDYSGVLPHALERARLLGQAVHEATQLYDDDRLDFASLPAELEPYLDAWARFREDKQFVPETVEQLLYHPIYRYAGTADRTGFVDGELAVIDLKKMLVLERAIGVQLAGYQIMLNHRRRRPEQCLRRYALGLRADGTYRLRAYIDPDDAQCFLGLLNLFNWRQKDA